MRLRIDEEADAVYLRLDESAIVESEEVRPGVVLDFDKDDCVVGVEFLGISKRVSPETLRSFSFESRRA